MTTTLAELNAADRDGFVAALGHLFEHSRWVAEETWERRPFRNAAHLHAELCATLRAASQDLKLKLIRAHPDLAGRLAQLNQLTASSTNEQASAGLDRLPPGELARFQKLNHEYRARFGFPFIICARLNDRDAILNAMQSRVENPPAVEVSTALSEIEKIARLRLDDVLKA
jgi:2-oxo-4-hydroxy-4-carboxy-5-ureidoimidazoline decarboxylase